MEQFRWEEIRLHNQKESCWIVIESFVYDVTEFLSKHPAGPEIILEQAGKDATKPFFNAGHPQYAKEYLKKYRIGEISEPEQKTVIKLPSVITSESLKTSTSFTAARNGGGSQNKLINNWKIYIFYGILGFTTLFGVFIIILFLKM